jgi:hypothetical protein
MPKKQSPSLGHFKMVQCIRLGESMGILAGVSWKILISFREPVDFTVVSGTHHFFA